MLGGATVDARWSDVSKRRRIQDPKPINAMKYNKVGRQSLEGARQDKTFRPRSCRLWRGPSVRLRG